MKSAEQVTAEKIRGGFYSPAPLVDVCLQRIHALLRDRSDLTVLEPSAGDGAFIRGFSNNGLAEHVASVTAVELVASEAAKCRSALRPTRATGRVVHGSFIEWVTSSPELYDAAVGNPPFVRFQFLSEPDKAAIPALGNRLGVSLAGVSNLWIPVFLGALSRLKPGGAFAFIIPAECFTGVSANTVRRWLGTNARQLRVDIFPPGSFRGVLQEVVVLSGMRRRKPLVGSEGTLSVCEHVRHGRPSSWSHHLNGFRTWTPYLLTPLQLDALYEARELAVIGPLLDYAKFEVSSVTGANEYFSVNAGTVADYELDAWAIPLLARSRHAPGLRYTKREHAAMEEGVKSRLLHFSADRPDPTSFLGASAYIREGERAELHRRYKTRIRTPWYRVPLVFSGRLMLSKRCHRYPRVILNDAGVVTTDTIYRGWMQGPFEGHEEALVASFHNSLTLATAEIEGRSFGGGVLELVPSEIGRLLIPTVAAMDSRIAHLDRVARSANDPEAGEALVEATDLLLIEADVGFSEHLVATIREARFALMKRRLARS